MIKLLILFLVTLALIMLIDFFWIGVVVKNLYLNEMGKLLRMENGQFKPIYVSALFVYVLVVFGILFFVLPQADTSILKAFIYGAAYGLIIYGVYDFTCYATIADWPLKLSLIDVLWGTLLCGIGSAMAFTTAKVIHY